MFIWQLAIFSNLRENPWAETAFRDIKKHIPVGGNTVAGLQGWNLVFI